MIIAATLFAVIGLLLNVAAATNFGQPQKGNNKNLSKKNTVLVSVGMTSIAVGMMLLVIGIVL